MLHLISDFLITLCARCCDLMYGLAHILGVSYEVLNMLFFYILQPVIYSLLLLWELLYLSRYSQVRWVKYFFAGLSLIPVSYGFVLFSRFYGENLDSLCLVKIHNLRVAAQQIGITYAAINDLIFILGFLFLCFLHLLFLWKRKTKMAYIIACLFLVLSPFFVFVFHI